MHEFWIFPRMLPRVEFSNSFPYMEKTVYGGHKVKLTSFTNMYILIPFRQKQNGLHNYRQYKAINCRLIPERLTKSL